MNDRYPTAATQSRGDFRSDNVARVEPSIMAALLAANTGTQPPYGADEYSTLLDARFSELFEAPCRVFPVATGTAANALALAACLRSYGGVFCHEGAHIRLSEGGAVTAFSAGGSLLPLRGEGGMFDARELAAGFDAAGIGNTQRAQPDAVSVTQVTERGRVYAPAAIAGIGAFAREKGLHFHMDGARFANALARLGCGPAEITTKLGVDILSFGATKNGAMSADAIVVFKPELVEPLRFLLRRAGQTWSKMRFAAAQLLAYVEDGLWLKLAAQANANATRLSQGLAAIPGVELLEQVDANIVFARLPPATIDRMIERNFHFYRRAPDTIRLVCRYDAPAEAVEGLLEAARG